jgi:hypothetical protein
VRMEAWRQWLLGGLFSATKKKTHYEPKIPLTPIGLLMEGLYTQNPGSSHSECYRDLSPTTCRHGYLQLLG